MDMINNLINNFVLQLSSWGLIGGLFLILLESIIPALPLGVFIGMNMLAFGNVTGFFLSYFSTIIGCMISFSVFKYVVKDALGKETTGDFTITGVKDTKAPEIVVADPYNKENTDLRRTLL